MKRFQLRSESKFTPECHVHAKVDKGRYLPCRDRQAKSESQSLLLVRIALPASSLSLFDVEAQAAASLVSTIQSQQGSHVISLHGPSGSGASEQALCSLHFS